MKIAGKPYMSIFKSPLGDMFLTSDGESLISVRFDFQKKPVYEYVAERKNSLKIFRETKKWLRSYFKGEDIPFPPMALLPYGTPFWCDVWRLVCTIPFGGIITLEEVTKMIRLEEAWKNVTLSSVRVAVNQNPMAIIVPTHRVIGHRRKFLNGDKMLETKLKLLKLEGIKLSKFSTSRPKGYTGAL